MYIHIRAYSYIHTFGPSGTHTHRFAVIPTPPSDTIYANELHASSSSAPLHAPVVRPRFNGRSCTAPVSDVRYIHIYLCNIIIIAH